MSHSLENVRKTGHYWVYLVECCDHSYYTGISTDVVARVAAHNAGRGSKYARSRRPVKLKAAWEIGSIGPALKVEHEIKKWPHAKKKQIASSFHEHEFQLQDCAPQRTG